MSGKATEALEILANNEQAELVVSSVLGSALEAKPLTFIVFACLGTERGKEELRLDLYETIFLKRFRRQAEKLFHELETAKIPATLLIILPDLEPRRTWGWQVPQEELSGLCRLMIEDAVSRLPQGWDAVLWSDLETRAAAGEGYIQALQWAEVSAPPLLLRDEKLFFRELGKRHPDLLTQGSPEVLARRQIAAYAHEGRVLEQLFPRGILLQTDTPVQRKDAMFMPLRREPLVIAHPFTR